MRALPPATQMKKEHPSGAPETSFEDGMKSLRLFDLYKKKIRQIKRLKNTEIHLVFLRPLFFCCHIGWGTQWLFPEAPANTVPLFLQWHSAARRWNSWTNIRDLFLPERGERQHSISIFIFSHSFYFPQVCILYTCLRLCLVIFFILSCITRSYLWYKKAPGLVWPVITCMRSLKTAVCLHFHTLFGCIFL